MATGTSQGFAVGTSSVALSSATQSSTRSYLLIQNTGNANVYIAFGTSNQAVASPTPNGFLIQPNQFYEKGRLQDRNAFPSAGVPQTDIAAVCAAGTSTTVTILEM